MATVLLVLPAMAVAPAAAGAGTAPGSTETLAVAASGERGVGKELTITAEGVADGSHRLFVFGEASGCGGWPVNQEADHAVALTTPGGELLPAGQFARPFAVVPQNGNVYGVCAFLDASPSALPDAWGSGCFALDSGADCRLPELDPLGIVAAEEIARKVVQEEEQQRSEREARERAAAEAAARAQADLNAREARRCHVPRLLGHTLAGSRRLLAAAHCSLGRVTPRHRPRGRQNVRWQRPGRGGSYAPGTPVSVSLGR